MIVQHPGKLTIKEIEEISSEGDVLNNFFYSDRYPTVAYWWTDSEQPVDDLRGPFTINVMMHGWEIAHRLGTPNCNMKGYESYPGAWVFDDTEYGLRWLVFSDGIRKGHYKGTSYEVSMKEPLSEADFKKAIRKFFTHFGCYPLSNSSVC